MNDFLRTLYSASFLLCYKIDSCEFENHRHFFCVFQLDYMNTFDLDLNKCSQEIKNSFFKKDLGLQDFFLTQKFSSEGNHFILIAVIFEKECFVDNLLIQDLFKLQLDKQVFYPEIVCCILEPELNFPKVLSYMYQTDVE